MISEISVQNFKSIEKLELGLGRVTVLIGENGSGKSNILEAIALLGAAAADKLDNEFLVSRGIRMADTQLMVSAFPIQAESEQKANAPVQLTATSTDKRLISFDLFAIADLWYSRPSKFLMEKLKQSVERHANEQTNVPQIDDTPEKPLKLAEPTMQVSRNGFTITFSPLDGSVVPEESKEMVRGFMQGLLSKIDRMSNDKDLQCGRFLIYTPENSALRRFEEEGQIQPVGVRGEGLFKMLQTFANGNQMESLAELNQSLQLFGWFVDFSISPNLAPGDNRLRIHDRFLGPDVTFDQRSANEGFLFLIFYFAVFLSKSTPPFFAIDNIDAALNPKLCAELMRRICELAKKYDKQVIVTTHNPAILDGLNLSDDEQRLYTVYRDDEGRTKVRRIQAPKPRPGETLVKLSDAFLHGLIGGLPKNF
jgi:predicted ATPase